MNSFHMLHHSRTVVKQLSANLARNSSVPSLSQLLRLAAVHLPLVAVNMLLVSKTFVAKFAGKHPLFVLLNFLTSCRVVTLVVRATVLLLLMSVHIAHFSEAFVAQLAGKLLLGCTSGRVVTLVVRVQLFNAAMVTGTDLTHDVPTKASLKHKKSSN